MSVWGVLCKLLFLKISLEFSDADVPNVNKENVCKETIPVFVCFFFKPLGA